MGTKRMQSILVVGAPMVLCDRGRSWDCVPPQGERAICCALLGTDD